MDGNTVCRLQLKHRHVRQHVQKYNHKSNGSIQELSSSVCHSFLSTALLVALSGHGYFSVFPSSFVLVVLMQPFLLSACSFRVMDSF